MASILPQLVAVYLALASSALTSATALKFSKWGHFKASKQGIFSRARTPLEDIPYDGSHIFNYTYTQTLDHFNFRPDSYATFQQRYYINYKYWGGAKSNSPIFVYTAGEWTLDVDSLDTYLDVIAPQFQALLVFIEHRYYGESNPFGSKREAYSNSSTLGYLSSSQALADFAELVVNLKKNLSAENCPVVAIGESYGGMLASWFRLKYPHIVYGALASSAPILYFDDITPQNGYDSVVTRDFKEVSESCYITIKDSWFEIDKVASQPNGLNNLSQTFNTCSPIGNIKDLKDSLENIYDTSAQYNVPSVIEICNAIDGAPQEANVLERIFTIVKLFEMQCLDITNYNDDTSSPETLFGWYWQTCTEMVMPFGRDSNDTMFQADPFNITKYTMECRKKFGVTPRPHWITTEFGGHNISFVLKKFRSNIIFSNGLHDPYSSGGVLHNISDSILAIYTTQGSHCLDMEYPKSDDPDWLISQRNAETIILESWIAEYKTAKTNNYPD